ncbi:MAG: hypothetical protein ACXVA6_17750 [Isosphaeraceae bacterium]
MAEARLNVPNTRTAVSSLIASSNVTQYTSGSPIPGVTLGASRSLAKELKLVGSPTALITLGVWEAKDFERIASSMCSYDGADSFDRGGLSGILSHWSDCPGNTQRSLLAAIPDDGTYVAILIVIAASDDTSTATHVLDTFSVTSPLPA